MGAGEEGGQWLQVLLGKETRLQMALGKTLQMVVWEKRLHLDVRENFQVLPVAGRLMGKLQDTHAVAWEESLQWRDFLSLRRFRPFSCGARRGFLEPPPMAGHFHLQELLWPRPVCLLTTSPSSVSYSWA